MTITDREIRNHVRAIRQRGKTAALVMRNNGEVQRYEYGSGMYERAMTQGGVWIGTYDRDVCAEMIADDLEASGVEVSP